MLKRLDSGFRWNEGKAWFLTLYEFVKQKPQTMRGEVLVIEYCILEFIWDLELVIRAATRSAA